MIQQWPYKNQPAKHCLTHLVSNRRRMLYNLREKDYKKFEWLLEKLNLLYKPMPWDSPHGTVGVYENIERKKRYLLPCSCSKLILIAMPVWRS